MSGEVTEPSSPGSAGSQETAYIPVRVLGRGAFGEAVLYRRLEDNSLVVWKEVNLTRLGDRERSEAQNEIDILSLLNHSNIVSYYNHFLDGEMLLIEMEYADGGNLHEKIMQEKELFHEETAIWYFFQLVSAVAHIHNYGILHRDIKTLNIFMTKADIIKLGDFGISKVLNNKSEMAESYVGTPYYMSPELIKGEQYNQKSDIWASGCVLYELLTLTKVFDATNPLKLAQDIVCTEFAEINERYSDTMKTLVNDLLNKDATKRPTAEELLKHSIFGQQVTDLEKKVWDLSSSTRRLREVVHSTSMDTMPVVTTKSSEVYFWGGGKLTPQKVEHFQKCRGAIQVAAGKSHFAVVTMENELYTWGVAQGGDRMVGQLGHGDTAMYKAPKRVEAFEGMHITQVSCGDDFTVSMTDEGNVYAFGSDYNGCLGCDNQEGDEVCTPVLVPHFTSNPVHMISCGDAHVVALTQSGDVYTWGCGEYGRLGLGSEDDMFVPQKVQMQQKHPIKSVRAGSDRTFLLNTNGRLLACGSNEYNKLGLNAAVKGLRNRNKKISYDIPCKFTFTTVKPLSKYIIEKISAGTNHTAVIDYTGNLITFGCNKYGQLGVGDYKEHSGINVISGALSGKLIHSVSCGDGFTVISTSENQLYSWGLAEDGRLGSIYTDKALKNAAGQCVSIPRPIFGSLHIVSDLSSHHWQSILVAEKVLSQKTIMSTGSYTSQTSDQSEPGVAEENGQDSERTSNSAGPSLGKRELGESTAPAWLKHELEEAEFIPKLNLGDQDTNRSEQADNKSEDFTEEGDLGFGDRRTSLDCREPSFKTNKSPVPESSDGSCEDVSQLVTYLDQSMNKADCLKLIGQLQKKVDKLEADNQFLHKKVAQQVDQITNLEAKCAKFSMSQTM